MSIVEIDSLIYIIGRNDLEDSCAYFLKTAPSKQLRTVLSKLLFLYKKVEILNFINIKQQKSGKKLLFYTIYLNGKQYASARINLKTNQVWFQDVLVEENRGTPPLWSENELLAAIPTILERLDELEKKIETVEGNIRYIFDYLWREE